MIWKNLYIEKLVAGGYGLARTEAGIVFVSGVIPGETVNGTQYGKKGKTVYIKADEIVISSDKRVEPPCKYYGKCGGCSWQFIDYEEQIRQKREIFTECLRRTGKIREIPEIDVFKSEPRNYRIRSQIRAEKGISGFYSSGTNDIIDIDYCIILDDLINKILTDKKTLPDGIIKAVAGDKLATEPVIKDLSHTKTNIEAGSYSFLVPGSGFFQSNRFLLKELGTWALNKISGDFCLDIYGGVGFFSIMLNKCFRQCILIDNSQVNTLYAEKNIKNNNLEGFKAVCADAAEFLQKGSFPKPDCIIIDPPRTGMSKKVISAVSGLKPCFILSVSCDPATHARDLNYLVKSAGYSLKELALFDLYPQTSHIETAALLELTGTKTNNLMVS
jgi:23S rRNA (uracil1939-C5)-methyltransferase